MMVPVIYLLHFASPITPGHPCQHYLGYAANLEARLAQHRAGQGARLTQVAVERGIAFTVARTWPGDRSLERQLKRYHQARRLCPVCCATAGRAVWTPPPCRDDEPLPQTPVGSKVDWFQITRERAWRAARPQPTPLPPLPDDDEWF